MAFFSKKAKKSKSDQQPELVDIDFQCLISGHVSPVYVSENLEGTPICPTCQNPLIAKILAEVLRTGKYTPSELNSSDLVHIANALFFIYWSQHNVQCKPLQIMGQAKSEIRSSWEYPADSAIQGDLVNTLNALDSYGSGELGDASEIFMWLALGRDFLQWKVEANQVTGAQTVWLEPLPFFAAVNAKNTEALSLLAQQVSSQLMRSEWQLYVDMFQNALKLLVEEQKGHQAYEVEVSFRLHAETEDEPLVTELLATDLELVNVQIVPNFQPRRLPSGLVGPIGLQVETNLEAYSSGRLEDSASTADRMELEYKINVKFKVFDYRSSKEQVDENFRLRLDTNFSLAIYYSKAPHEITWRHFQDELVLEGLELGEMQLLSLGSTNLSVSSTGTNMQGRLAGVDSPWPM